MAIGQRFTVVLVVAAMLVAGIAVGSVFGAIGRGGVGAGGPVGSTGPGTGYSGAAVESRPTIQPTGVRDLARTTTPTVTATRTPAPSPSATFEGAMTPSPVATASLAPTNTSVPPPEGEPATALPTPLLIASSTVQPSPTQEPSPTGLPTAPPVPTATSTSVPSSPTPTLVPPIAREPRAHRNSTEQITFEWEYPPGELPPDATFTVVLRGPTGIEYRPETCAGVVTVRCVAPAPPPDGPGQYEWWVEVTMDGVPTGSRSNVLAFPWELPPAGDSQPPSEEPTQPLQPTEEPAPTPEPTEEAEPTEVPPNPSPPPPPPPELQGL